MSRTLLRSIKLCTGKFSNATLPSRLFSDRNGGSDENNNNNQPDRPDLRHTTILVQHGTNFEELPVIVRKVDQTQLVAFCSNTVSDQNGDKREFQPPRFNTEEVVKNINRCLTTNGVLSILEAIPTDELAAAVCLAALRKIAGFETELNMRNIEKSLMFEVLMGCIVHNGDNRQVLEAFETLKRHVDLAVSIDALCDELLRRNTERCLSVEECCEAVLHFVHCKRTLAAEKFWLSLCEQEKQITADNIQLVYKVLPAFRVSRRVVLNVLEKRITGIWWQLKPDSVVDILNSLAACKISPFRTMLSLSRWTNTNIHALDEATLTAVIGAYSLIEYTDAQIEKALERYVKAKGVKIKSQLLVVTILDHCRKFRLRNSHILNGCSEFFMLHATTGFEAQHLKPLLQAFGTLDMEPLQNIKFWKSVEQYLNDHFDRMAPADVVETMLNCVYLQKYPLNFVKRIFNPYFLDVLHTTSRPEMLPKLRSDLKLFDTSLTLECPDYDGPLLPRDHAAKSLWVDGRIRRICNQIRENVTDLAGGHDRFMCGVVLHQLPVNELYVVDILLHPPGMSNLWSFNTRKDRNVQTAILVHLPEHYCGGAGEVLVGPQSMRHRHLRRLGMRVASMSYDVLTKLRIHPKELLEYMTGRLKRAEDAFPEF